MLQFPAIYRFLFHDRQYTSSAEKCPYYFGLINNKGEAVPEALRCASQTWGAEDGLPIVDYSLQKLGGRKGKHADFLEANGFEAFLEQTRPIDFDLMLEIKDKEQSALRAVSIAATDPRFVTLPGFHGGG